jgi:hypothetical protein
LLIFYEEDFDRDKGIDRWPKRTQIIKGKKKKIGQHFMDCQVEVRKNTSFASWEEAFKLILKTVVVSRNARVRQRTTMKKAMQKRKGF